MALLISVKVVPSAGRVAWALDKTGTLKCYLKNPPEQGKANRELIQLLARTLKMPENRITLVRGMTTRTKLVRIEVDYSYEQLLDRLEIQRQLKIIK